MATKRILIVTPAPPGSRKGNRITAERWRRLLRSAGYSVTVAEEFQGQPADVLVALHARKSARSIARFRAERPESPLFVVLTGTDIYQDLPISKAAQRSLAAASRLILLQPEAHRALSPPWRRKARVIRQSAEPVPIPARTRKDRWEVCVIAHLRQVKDPFRAAFAARLLPPSSRVHIVQIGAALSASMARRARAEMARNPRFTWLGERTHAQARQRLAQSRLLVLSSRLEGGANVVSEAIVAGVPVIASEIPGSIGLLGKHYPGYFPAGDTRALAQLLHRAETDAAFLRQLAEWCARLRPQFTPAEELARWREILSEFGPA